MIPYATPEWVEEMGKNYRANPENQNKYFKGMTIFLSFRILANPKFGLDEDVYFSTHLENGALQDDSALIGKEGAEEKSDFILSAPPSVWKRVIQKEEGFVAAFMTGKISLDKGEAPKMLGLASRSPIVISLFPSDTEWPDEMSPQRLEEYKAQVKEFRERLRV